MAVLYMAAGINHFRSPGTYIKIIPPGLPYPEVVNYITGIAEFALGLLLLFNKTRRFSAWGIIVLLAAVFPANVQMLINYSHQNDPAVWIAVIRLPLQIPLIFWAYAYTKKRYRQC